MLIHLAMPAGFARESLLGDLTHEFRERAARGGMSARLWFWRTAFQVASAFVWDAIRHAPATITQDLRFAVRSFSRSPAFTFFASATLAVGIGATTSVFSVADALLLRPLQLHEPDRLVRVHVTEPSAGAFRVVVAAATYLDWRERARSFEDLAAFRPISYNVLGGDFPERVPGVSVTDNFFDVLGVPAFVGRTPKAADPVQEGRVAVLSHGYWQARFGLDPSVLGSNLVLDGEAHTVIGVMPPEFTVPADVEVFVPSPFRVPMAPGRATDQSEDRGGQYMSVMGRLSDGVTIQSAQTEMDAISAEIERENPANKEGEGAAVARLRDDVVLRSRSTIVFLLGAVGFVMLIACANVANLLTVRASRRGREIAVRMALGAGVGRIRRQLLTESVLLSALGGLLGFLVAILGTGALVSMAPENIPRLGEVSVDLRVFAFSGVVALATGLLFGLAPAVGLTDRDSGVSGALRGGRSAEASRTILRDTVLVVEVALSLILLIGAGLMVRTFGALLSSDPGFDSSSTIVAHVSLPRSEYDDEAAFLAFFNEALGRLEVLPGVESAATVLTLPMHWALRGSFTATVEAGGQNQRVESVVGYQVVSPDYFRTMRIPVLRGRVVDRTDLTETTMVVVINEAFATMHWPDADPVGRRLTFWGDPDDPETEWATIVGVVGNTSVDGVDSPPITQAYLAQSQSAMNRATFVVRTTGDPYDMAPALRNAVSQVDASLPLYGLSSLDDVVADDLSARRFSMSLLGVFAGAGLLMAAIGLYGVLSFSVAQRAREIGIRKALGARSRGVVLRVVLQGYQRVGLGLALGVAASVSLSRLLTSHVFGISPTDARTYAGAVVLLGVVALLACWVPAARAARVDPLEAIRTE